MKKFSPSELAVISLTLWRKVLVVQCWTLEEQQVSGASFVNLREDLREVASLLADRATNSEGGL